MASKVGELQARLLRIDALGERLTKVAGLKPQDFMFRSCAGSGWRGFEHAVGRVSMKQLGTTLDPDVQRSRRSHRQIAGLESMLTEDSAKRQLVPSGMPVDNGFYSSNFGWRIDPFTGLTLSMKAWTSWQRKAL
jgi:hypothetical protein